MRLCCPEQVMGLLSKNNLLFILCCICLESSSAASAIDTITSSQSIKDPDYIISNGSSFKLGLFSPVNSTNRSLRIWYNNIFVFTVVWVANRDKPWFFWGSYYICGRTSSATKRTKGGNLVSQCYNLCSQFNCLAFVFREPCLATKNYRDNHMAEFPTSLWYTLVHAKNEY